MKGTLCISLDFEKFWGIHDVSDLNDVSDKMIQVSSVVDRLLDMFDKYDIHCTWAVVGLLNMRGVKSLNKFEALPYVTKDYSPFPVSKFEFDNINASIIFANNNIERIKTEKNQELASHTFSHYYCLEQGLTSSDFKEDMSRFKSNVSNTVKSIVFPRNQINTECLAICSQHGLTAYRGNQANKYWRNSNYKNESLIQKIGRTVDAYIKISKDNFIEWQELKNTDSGMINIAASRFFKPHKTISFIENLKIKRIKKQMLKSAKANSIYHLWWHPHNFTSNTNQNFKQLEEVLIYFSKLKNEYNYQSLTMNEITTIVE